MACNTFVLALVLAGRCTGAPLHRYDPALHRYDAALRCAATFA
jgi:hypothetical protein